MRSAVVLFLLAACGTSDGRGDLVYVDAEDQLVVLDVASGERRPMHTGRPYYGGIATGAGHFAYFNEAGELFRAPLGGGAVDRIEPVPGWSATDTTALQLGGDGWVGFSIDTTRQYVVVPKGSTEARVIGGDGRYLRNVTASPRGDLLAYVDCDAAGAGDVVVERVDGTERTVLASTCQILHGLAFAPEGAAVVGDAGDGHVYLWPTDGGSATDLGVATLPLPAPPGGSVFSPRGEVLTLLSAGETRVVSREGEVTRSFPSLGTPTFAATGAVLFHQIELEGSGDYHTHSIADDAGTRTLLERDELCATAVLSPTGHHTSYFCRGGRMVVQRLADGELVYESTLAGFPLASPLGFSRDGSTALFRAPDGVRAVDVDGDAWLVVDIAEAPSSVAYHP